MSIKEVFDQECSHVKIDIKFYKKICELEAKFVNKKQEHIEFFGGTLTGAHVVRFTQEDADAFFVDLLQADDANLRDLVYAVKDQRGHPVIVQSRHISSDIFNIACFWLIHAIHHSPYLDDAHKQEAKIRICTYLMYKYLTSLMAWYFKYPADPEVCAATYAQLNYKFILKQTGSWGATIREFASKAVALDGIHAKRIDRLDQDDTDANDNQVVKFLNDTQGRIRDTFKNIYAVFMDTHTKGMRISTKSALVETDGEIILKDKANSLIAYTRYLKSIISDEHSFIRQEIVDVIAKVMHTMPERLLVNTLKWMSQNYGHTKDQVVERAVDLVTEHAFDYLSANQSILGARGDLAGLISKLRGTYMSSRATDAKLLETREMMEDIVYEATRTRNESVIAATRTGVMIYLVVRMFSMRHYAG